MNRLRIRSSNFRSPSRDEDLVKIVAVGFQDQSGSCTFAGGSDGNTNIEARGRQDQSGSCTFQVLRRGMQDQSGRCAFLIRFHGVQDQTGSVTFAGQVLTSSYRMLALAAMPASVAAVTIPDYPAENLISGIWLRTTANGGQVISSTANDVRFETEAGVSLDHEKLAYSPTSGTLRYVVRVPSWLTSQQYRYVIRYGGS